MGESAPWCFRSAPPRSGLCLGSLHILPLKESPSNPLRSGCTPPYSESLSPCFPPPSGFLFCLLKFSQASSGCLKHLFISGPSRVSGCIGNGEHVDSDCRGALPPHLGDLRQSLEEWRPTSFLHFAAVAVVVQPLPCLSPFYWPLLFCPNHFFTWLPHSCLFL